MRGFFTAFARNTVFANIVIFLIFFGGGMAVWQTPLETFPDLAVDMIGVQVVWPGADPEEVEEGICRKIEEAIGGLEGIKRYHTIADENVGFAQIEVDDHYEMEDVKERVRNAVESISTFPPDAERVLTQEIVFRINVTLLALASDDMSERELKEYAETVKEEIRAIPGISQVVVLGERDYEIAIEVSETRLREYGLTFDQVALIVRANCLNVPGGIMRTRGEEIRLRTLGRKYTAEEFADIVVLARPNGDNVTLDRIATLKDDFTEESVISRFNGKRTAVIGVLRTTEEDTLGIDKSVRAYVADKQKQLPEGIELGCWARMAPMLQARIRLLVRNGLIGLTLVFILLWLFLDIRLSFWVGMGMPVSVMGALVILRGMDETINMISLFGLVMVLGIIVDDAIVVGEAIYVSRKNGAGPLEAAVNGVMEVGMPVVAAVTTTLVAFVPLFFVTGFMGKLIAVLPVIVIASLTISLIECLLLLPAHLSHLPDPEARRGGTRGFGQRFHRFTNEGLEWFVAHVYGPFITKVLRWRYVSLGVSVTIVLATWGLVEGGFIEFQFFPEIDGNSVAARVEFPSGAPLGVTKKAVLELEQAFRRVADKMKTASGDPLIENMFSLAGAMIGDKGESVLGTHLCTVRVELLDSAKRGIYFKELIAAWEEEIGAIPGAIAVTFTGDEISPPGAPIEVWLQGRDLDELQAASQDLKTKLTGYNGVYQIQDDFRTGKDEIKLRLKPEARMLGIMVAHLAQQVHAGYFGEEAIRLQRGRDDLRVRVRYPLEHRSRLSEFERVRIRTPYGFEVPILSVADVEYGPGYAAIKRTNSMRRIAVTAEVDPDKANANTIARELDREYFVQLRNAHPGVHVSLEGEQQSMRESLADLYVGYPLALLGIFIIIATIFRSYIQPIVIMVTVPFGTIGAIFGHMLMGFDITMMSLFGIVALAGVVVNDAIVLIECINNFIADGTPFFEAIRKGGARRFRAIFLTTISTVGGLTPLIIEKDFQAQILIPMAISIAAGVAFATLLTLLLIPCLLGILNDFRRVVFWLATGRWPTAEEVEPARKRKAGYGDAPATPTSQPTREAG